MLATAGGVVEDRLRDSVHCCAELEQIQRDAVKGVELGAGCLCQRQVGLINRTKDGEEDLFSNALGDSFLCYQLLWADPGSRRHHIILPISWQSGNLETLQPRAYIGDQPHRHMQA